MEWQTCGWGGKSGEACGVFALLCPSSLAFQLPFYICLLRYRVILVCCSTLFPRCSLAVLFHIPLDYISCVSLIPFSYNQVHFFNPSLPGLGALLPPSAPCITPHLFAPTNIEGAIQKEKNQMVPIMWELSLPLAIHHIKMRIGPTFLIV